jgi:hypothetical protein
VLRRAPGALEVPSAFVRGCSDRARRAGLGGRERIAAGRVAARGGAARGGGVWDRGAAAAHAWPRAGQGVRNLVLAMA